MAIVIGGVSYCTGSSQGNLGGGSPILTPCPGQQIGSPGAGGSAASNTPVNSPYVPPPVFDPVGDPPPAGIVQLQYLAAPASVYMATVNPALLGFGLNAPMYYASSPTGESGSWTWSNAGMTSSAGALMWFQVFNGVGYAFCTGGLFVQEQAGVSPWVLRTASPPNIMGGYVAPSGHILMTTNDNQNLNNANSTPPSGAMTSVWSSIDGGVTFEKIYTVAATIYSNFDGVIAPFTDVTLVGLNSSSAEYMEWYEVEDSDSGFSWGALNTAAGAAFPKGMNDYFQANGLQALAPNTSLPGFPTGCVFSINNQAYYASGTLADSVQYSFVNGQTAQQILNTLGAASAPSPLYANNSNTPVEPSFAPQNNGSGGGGFGFFNSPAAVLSGANFATATELGASKSFSSIAYQTIAPGAIMGVDGEKNLFYSGTGAPLSGAPVAANFAQVSMDALAVLYVPPLGTNLFSQGGFVAIFTDGAVQFGAGNGASLVGKAAVPFAPLAAVYNDAAVFVTGANGQSVYSYDLENWTSTSAKTGTADLPSAWGGKVS